MIGAGKYDDALTAARKACGATGAILIVLDGELGSGFSVQVTSEMLASIPRLLRKMAVDIEADLAKAV